VAWLDRERDLIEDALNSAYGMQGAPDWYSFVDIFLERIERSYQLEKEDWSGGLGRRNRPPLPPF